MKSNNILLVEDNPEYAKAAEKLLINRGFSPIMAKDYEEALNQLEATDYHGIITDCSFPPNTNVESSRLEERLIEKLIEKLTRNQQEKIMKEIKEMNLYIDLNDEELKEYTKIFLGKRNGNPLEEEPLFQHLKIAYHFGNKEKASETAREIFPQLFPEENSPEYQKLLSKAMKDSSEYPPLGLFIAENAKSQEVPVVLTLSQEHPEPLKKAINTYAKNLEVFTINGNSRGKDSSSYWENALDSIK